MAKFLIRLDDAARYMNTENWKRIEEILDKYNIKPIVGVIPYCKDKELFYDKSFTDDKLWELVKSWEKKGWTIGLHGYEHLYFKTNAWRYVPIWNRSEFAGLPLREQREKIKKAYEIFLKNGIKPKVFIAPSHTFDRETLKALSYETEIRIISDCFAFDVFYEEGFYFIPQQLWKIKEFPFGLWTVCLHPNTFNEANFKELEMKLAKYRNSIISMEEVSLKQRKWNYIERFINFQIWYNRLPKVKNFLKKSLSFI